MTATEQLAKVRQEAATAKREARDLAAVAQAAQAKAQQAREALVEAHADRKGVSKLEGAHGKALADAESAAIEAEGAGRRAARAEQAVLNFLAVNNQALLDDLEPSAVAVRDKVAEAFRSVFSAAAEWDQVAQQASALVTASGRGSPRDNGPGENPYASAIHSLRQAIANGPDIPLPLPHWRHVKFLEDQERAALERKEAA